MLLVLALLVAVSCGVAGAYLASQMRAVFFDAHGLKDVVGLPILGTVTMVPNAADVQREKLDVKRFLGASAGLVGVYVVGIVTLSLMAAKAG